MTSAQPESPHADPFGPEGSSRWAASEAQSMEALFAPAPDPRTGYQAPYGYEHRPPVPQQPRPAHRDGARRRRRQWGHDRRTRAMPVVARPVSDQRLAMGRLAIMLTVTAWIGYFVWWLLEDLLNRHYSGTVDRAESILYLLIVTVLTASSLAYLLSRLGSSTPR
jgi:hypothetical protein